VSGIQQVLVQMIGFREGCVHTKIVTLSETALAVQKE